MTRSMTFRQSEETATDHQQESVLQRQVLELCDELGLWYLHVPDSRKLKHSGWPDLVIIGPGGVIFRELKSGDGSVSKWQLYVLKSLERAGMNAGVWRPRDWATGFIENALKDLATG